MTFNVQLVLTGVRATGPYLIILCCVAVVYGNQLEPGNSTCFGVYTHWGTTLNVPVVQSAVDFDVQ